MQLIAPFRPDFYQKFLTFSWLGAGIVFQHHFLCILCGRHLLALAQGREKMSSYKGDHKVLYGWQVCHVFLPFSGRFNRRRDRTKKQPSVCYWPSELPFVSVVKQQVLIFRSKSRCIILPFQGRNKGGSEPPFCPGRAGLPCCKSSRFPPAPCWSLPQPCSGSSAMLKQFRGGCAACLNSSASHGLGEAVANLQSGGWGSLCAAEEALPRLRERSTGGITGAGWGRGSGPLGDAEAHAGKVRTGHFPVCLTPPASSYEILFTLLLFCGKESKY